MADDKSIRNGRDRLLINTNEQYEIAYLEKKFGVSKEEVLRAVEQVGNERDAVEAYLRKSE
ncbi:DUF3606 domain-containing protein [Olivibacter sp. XZL3]|uniref:DUF3606 domain-containing protein n=1 Tax=Olivibacter sp. XZL3 TaxID=1735116 RepID=UPI001066D4A9|nr:DUF3606 domain-containing protein [Olivibacter sp. XZL3]